MLTILITEALTRGFHPPSFMRGMKTERLVLTSQSILHNTVR
jgi:hypothetical protein